MYKLNTTSSITRLSDGASIPPDPDNNDYAEYLRWVADGNTPEPYVVPPSPLPTVVTMRQARLALLGAGLLPDVTAAINALPSPQKEAAQIEWEYAQTVEREWGLVPMLGAALGLDDLALDQLFVTAAAL